METINVILADKSQLVRSGLIHIIKLMKYPYTIREINHPDKLVIGQFQFRLRPSEDI